MAENINANQKLQQLFKTCDKENKGWIEASEFEVLCFGLGIGADDSNAIFADLDQDGDGKIDFNDFTLGLQDFMSPGPRRGSILRSKFDADSRSVSADINDNYSDNFISQIDHNHQKAASAWKNLVQKFGEENITEFLKTSGSKLCEFYNDLRSFDASPGLLERFESALSAVVKDLSTLKDENRRLADNFCREKDNHANHLRNLEEELETQVSRIEERVKEQVRREQEAESDEVKTKLEMELIELKTHLKLFQRLDSFVKDRTNFANNDPEGGDEDDGTGRGKQKLSEAAKENKQLKLNLTEAETNLLLFQTELKQLKQQYEEKCKELESEKQSSIDYVSRCDTINRQLALMQGANRVLQDVNDTYSSQFSSTASQKHRSIRDSSVKRSASAVCERQRSPSFVWNLQAEARASRNSRSQPASLSSSDTGEVCRLQSDFATSAERPRLLGNVADIPSGRAKDGSFYGKATLEVPFGISRLIHDHGQTEDSGNSTMQELPDDAEPEMISLPLSLQDEIDDAQRRISCPDTESLQTRSQIFRDPGHYMPRDSMYHQMASNDWSAKVSPDRTYKIVFAGDAAVGKSCFITRACKGSFRADLHSTLGVDFQVKMFHVDGKNIALQLWDTAGQERFRSISQSYFRRADSVVLLYDVTSERSFLNVRQWITCIQDNKSKEITLLICGNKVDLREAATLQGIRCVPWESGRQLATEHDALFLETSSKSGENILEAMILLAREMMTNEDVEIQTSVLKITGTSKNQKRCC